MRKLTLFIWWLYLAAVFYVVFIGGERHISLTLLQRINLIPGKNILLFYRTNPHTGRFYYILIMEVLGNILLLIPFGFLMKISYPEMKMKRTVLYGFLMSATIELTQFFLQIGICDVGDVILNIIGVAVGAVFYNLISKKTGKLNELLQK